MKKKLMLGIMMLFLFLGVVTMEQRVNAEDGRVRILFELNVPEDFNEEIRIETRNLETRKRYSFSFAVGSDYASFLKVPPGEYSLEVEFEEGSVYTSNAQETYYFETEGQLVTFDIFRPEEDSSNASEDPVEIHMPTGEVYVEVKHPIYVYNDFLERFSYIEDDEYLNSWKGFFFKTDSGKRIFLQSNLTHTEEMYDNLSGYEVYIWDMILFWPREGLKEAPYSLEKYLESDMLSLMRDAFVEDIKPGYEGKEEAYYAIEDVWRWYYDYYEKTGEIFDFEQEEWFSIDNLACIQEPSLWTDKDTMLVKLFGTELTLEAQQRLEENSNTHSEVNEGDDSVEASIEGENSVEDAEAGSDAQESGIAESLIIIAFSLILIVAICIIMAVIFILKKKKSN